MTVKPEILEFAKQRDLPRSWLNLLSAQEEVKRAEARLKELKHEISVLDRLNVFTDTPQEAEEKDCKERVKARQKEIVRHAKDVAKALKDLSAEDSEFALALEMERYLRRSLEVASAAEAVKVGREVERCVDVLSKDHHSWTESDAPVELTGPHANLSRAALALAAALINSSDGAEPRWERSVPVLNNKPLLKRLVHTCRLALDSDLPGTPIPGALLAEFRGPRFAEQGSETSSLEALSKERLEPHFEALESICQEIGILRFTLRVNRGTISTLDRLNVFTDSESEAREKRFKAQLESLRVRFEDEMMALMKAHSVMRSELWPTWTLDLGHDLYGKVTAIQATEPSGIFEKTAKIINRDAPALAAHDFLQAVDTRFPGAPALGRLKSVISYWGEQVPFEVEPVSHFPMPRMLEEKEIAVLFHEALRGTDYASRREAILDAQAKLEALQSDISRQSVGQKALGALSLFVPQMGDGSWRERKAAEEYLTAAHREEEAMTLHALWEVYAPCALGHLLSELTTRIASITAVVHTRTVRTDKGSDRTEYYSVAEGKSEALETAALLRKLLEKSSSTYPFPHQWLEVYTENRTSQEIAAQPLAF